MADTNTVQYWVEQVNTKIADIVNAMKNYVEDFALDVEILPDDTDISTFTGVTNKMYLLKDASVSEGDNWYNEYIWVNNKLELIGTTKPDIKNFYTKDEVVNMLKSYYLKTETYSQTEVNNLLSAKANTADVYTKDDVNTALGKKANTADVYAKTETYSATEVDNMLADKANKVDTISSSEADTKISTALGNYYKKTETYSQAEVNGLLADKADAADVYTKEEVNNAVSTEGAKHYLKTETYSSAEVDTALGKKADTATTYTKVEVNTELGKKADASSVYPKTETYSQAEVNELLDGKAGAGDSYGKDDVYTKTEVGTQITTALTDYYKKSETYSQTEVDGLVSAKANSADVYTQTQVNNKLATKADASSVYTTDATYSKTEVNNLVNGKVAILAVDTLPETGAANTIYVVNKADGEEGNVKSEYLWINNTWELIGGTGGSMAGYYTSAEVDGLLANKADTSALTAKANAADVYTKGEVDTALKGKLGTSDKAASAKTADTATSATTATKDAGGNVITTTYATKTELGNKMDKVTLAKVATSNKYSDLDGLPAAVTSDTVAGWGYTKNAGTVTKVKVNGAEKTPTSGVVDLGTVITAHQSLGACSQKRGEFGANKNWNDYTEYGCYKVQSATMTAAYNAPVGEYAYGLLVVEVSNVANEARVTQIYYPHQPSGSAAAWTRTRNGNTWVAWKGMLLTTGTAAKAKADASGNTITSTYATKTELENALSTLATNLKNATLD